MVETAEQVRYRLSFLFACLVDKLDIQVVQNQLALQILQVDNNRRAYQASREAAELKELF